MPERRRKYSSAREATRVRTARWRARIRDERAEEPQDGFHQFQNIFLSFDPRAVPEPPRVEYPHWTVLDDLRESLDATPVAREIGSFQPIDLHAGDQSDVSPPPRPIRPRAEPEVTAPLDHDLEALQDPVDQILPIGDETIFADRSSKINIFNARVTVADETTLIPLGTPSPSHSHNPDPPLTVPPPSRATRTTERIPPVTELAIATCSWPAQLPPEPLAILLADHLQHPYSCDHEIPQQTPNPPPVTPHTCTLSLSTIVQWSCPDVLGIDAISQHPMPWDELIPPTMRRQVFTGISTETPTTEHDSRPSHPSPPTVELESDTIPSGGSLQTWFDIDSAGGFASNLAVARGGLDWKAGRAAVSNLSSSLHLEKVPVQWADPSGRLRQSRRPVHRVPHLPFGRLTPFRAIEVYILFPYLFEPTREQWVITTEEWAKWTNSILLPSLAQVYPSAMTQELPSSADHIRLNATAASIECRVQDRERGSHMQDFHYPLQAGGLLTLWEEIQRRIRLPGLSQFRDCRLLLTGKNLKSATQSSTWGSARDAFFGIWNQAVDASYLERDFYDIGKEVVCSRTSIASEPMPEPALTLSFRRCCLEGFVDSLTRSDAALDEAEETLSDNEPSSEEEENYSEPGDASPLEPQADWDVDPPLPISVSPPSEEPLPMTNPSSGLPTPIAPSEIATPSPPRRRRRAPLATEFYPQSLLRDQGSITVAPSPISPLYRRGLLYVQQYNSSKNILAAGKVYPFQDNRLDTLALDPGMVRTWQYVGGAISHSPVAVLRAYMHVKRRCHAAFEGCRDRSYGTREEFRVTGRVLARLDEVLRQQGLADSPIAAPSDAQPSWPFYIHTTHLMRDWWQWNINRLCLGFELTYSHQPRSFVHWEHTRVMMMFLKTLMCAYGGQGNQLRRSVGLWIDRRERRPGDGVGVERIQEGMSYGNHLEQFGYAWMADKIDWAAMTFLPAHRAHMVFNTPSLQSAYIAHYPEIVAAKADLILLGDVLYRLEQHRSDPKRSALLLRLLVDFCLRAYRKDVFEALSRRKTKQPKDSDRLTEARMGDVPLTGAGFRSVFRGGILDDDVHFVHAKSRMHVTHVHTLFSWIFGWDGDGDRGDWQREGWEYQPYRTIYFQCFSVVARLFGIQQAREWRLRVRQTWIRTHWVLPYPSSTRFWARDRGGRLQMWASIHAGLEQYIETHRASRSTFVRPRDVRKLPLTGWEPGACPSRLDVVTYHPCRSRCLPSRY